MPARLGAVARVLAEMGLVACARRKGSHCIFRSPGGVTYPIPAHNGFKSEIPDVYIRGACRAFGLDYDDVKKKL